MITGMLIKELNDTLGEACVDDKKSKIWLLKSIKLHQFLLKNKSSSEEYFKFSLKILYFLRCSYFWFTSNTIAFNIEVKSALIDFKEDSLFYVLNGLTYLNAFISANKKTHILDVEKLKIIKNAELCFSLAEKKQVADSYITNALLWFRAWFAYKLNRQDIMILLVKKAFSKDKQYYGEGWLFFIRWLSEIAEPNEFIILLESINKEIDK